MRVSLTRPTQANSSRTTDCCVVIDVLRATTTATVLTSRLPDVCMLRSPADLEHLPPGRGYALFSELSGVEVEFPRYDNSPVQARDVDLAGRVPVLITTNGTLAVGIAVDVAREVVLASFLNLSAVVDWLRASQHAEVMLMPAGNIKSDQVCLEDDKCAEAIAAALTGEAFDLAQALAACRDEPRILRRAEKEPGLVRDLDLCFAVDAVPVVPRVIGTSAQRYFQLTR